MQKNFVAESYFCSHPHLPLIYTEKQVKVSFKNPDYTNQYALKRVKEKGGGVLVLVHKSEMKLCLHGRISSGENSPENKNSSLDAMILIINIGLDIKLTITFICPIHQFLFAVPLVVKNISKTFLLSFRSFLKLAIIYCRCRPYFIVKLSQYILNSPL